MRDIREELIVQEKGESIKLISKKSTGYLKKEVFLKLKANSKSNER